MSEADTRSIHTRRCAQRAVQTILHGNPPDQTIAAADCGVWRDGVQAIYDAYEAGKTTQALEMYQRLCEQESAWIDLIARNIPDPDAAHPPVLPAVRYDDTPPQPATAFILACLDKAEFGDAQLLTFVYEHRLLYDVGRKVWFVWGGHYWSEDTTGLIFLLLAGQIAACYIEAAADVHRQAESSMDGSRSELRKKVGLLFERAMRLRTFRRATNVLNFAQRMVGISGSEWDRDPWLVGVQNGVLNLKTGALRNGQPSDYIKSVASATWHGADAPCERWLQYLRETFMDQDDVVDYMQRLLGYGLTGLSSERVLPIFFGEHGHNGKDTLLETIAAVLGPLAGVVSSDVMMASDRASSAGAATPHLMRLQGKRIVWASETEEGRKLTTAQVKALTGDSTIIARPLHGKQITFPPTHLMLLITNHKPHAPADDEPLWGRVRLIDFPCSFVANPTLLHHRVRDPYLKDKLKAELPGILAWLVQGCLQWQQRGLVAPAQITQATDAYRQDEDLIGLFLDECCIAKESAHVRASELYRAYTEWSEGMNLRVMSGTTFGKRIKSRFTCERGNVGVYYAGIGLLNNTHNEEQHGRAPY